MPLQGFRVFNTWMGDPHKLVILKAVLETIKQDNLIHNMAVQGETLKTGLHELKVGMVLCHYGIVKERAFLTWDNFTHLLTSAT